MVVIIAAVCIWMASGMLKPEGGDSKQLDSGPAASAAAPVHVQTLRSKAIDRSIYLDNYAVLKPVNVHKYFFLISGIVSEVNFKQGEYVKTGDVIAELDQEDLNAKLKAAKSALVSAKLDYKSALSLKKQSLGSNSMSQRALATVEEKQAEIKTIENNISKARIIAQSSGYIEELPFAVGDQVSPGGPDSIDFVDYSKMKVVTYVAQSKIKDIGKIGDTVRIKTRDDSFIDGKITFISQLPEKTSKTIEVNIEIDFQQDLIGDSVRALFPIFNGETHTVPASSLIFDSSGMLLLKAVDSENKVSVYIPKIISSNNDGIVVAELPNVLDIITIGALSVEHGDSVSR